MSAPSTILVVDDDPGMCETLGDVLEARGYAVVAAARGRDALDRLRTESIDAMVVDLKLPDVSGIELLRSIKAASPATEVIVITGYASLDSALQAMDEAAYAYLTKPFEVAHLLATLGKALERRRLTGALRQSEELYRLVNDNIMDAVFLLDLEGRLVMGNPRGFALTGYAEEELRGRSIISLLTPDGQEHARARLAAVHAGQDVPPLLETRLVRKDGREVWVEVNITSVMKDGRLMGRLGVARDISERKRAEEAARALYDDADRRRREAEVLGDVARAIGSATDLGVVLQQVAEGARALCGSDQALIALREEAGEAAVFRYWADPRHRHHEGQRVEPGKGSGGQVLLTGRPFRTDNYAEDPRITKDYLALVRTRRVIAQLVVPIRSQGRIAGLLYAENVTARPFTERDEMVLLRLADHAANVLHNHQLLLRERAARTAAEASEAALRESEAHYRRLVEGSIQGILVQQDGIVKFANTAMARMIGYDRAEDLVGLATPTFIAPQEVSRLTEYATARLRGEPAPARYEFEAVRRDGQPIWVEVLTSVVSWDGKPAVLATLLDITQRKQLEEQYRQSQKLEAIGSLAGGIAHDFNNLLTVIVGRSHIATWQLEPDSPIRRQLELIEHTTEQAARLTRQLLAFSRKQVLEPRVLALDQVVEGLGPILRRLISEDIALITESDDSLWRVTADPSQIEQVIMNLVVNARDAMAGGGRLTIETRNVEVDETCAAAHAGVEPGTYVMLAVSDTGHGMDATVQAKIFDPFFTTKEQGKGTGLGLSTVYGIVKQSGGHIWVSSEVGRGSVFRIYLPAVDAAPDSTVARPPGPAGGTETILLVEDEEQVRPLAREILEFNGYRVLEAAEPEEALRVARQHQGPIHLLLTDVIMPRMSGRALADRLLAARPGARVLFMSGYPSDAIAQHGVLDPGVSLLQKPFTPVTLAQKVRETLDAPRAP